ncbi:hypothetical protein Tco_0448553 [Tanacetum coccineum]
MSYLVWYYPYTIPDTTPSVIPPSTHIDTELTPTSLDYTPASPDYSPASDMEFDPSEDPSSDHIPPLPATSPFLSSTDNSLDSDTPNTSPSPTYGTPFTETTLSTQRSPIASGALRHRVMVLAPGQSIPLGRPYRYHLNGLVHLMTVRKRVRPLPTHRLAVRHSVDYSSLDHFSSDDSLGDSSLSSSSESSLNSFADALSNSASSCSYLITSFITSITIGPSHDSSSASPSRKRSRSPVASVPLSSPTLRALSYAHVDLLPSPKRIRRSESATDLKGCSDDSFEPYIPREVRLGVDFKDESSDPSRSRGTDLDMDADVVRNRGIDARVLVEAIDRDEIETGMKGPVEVRVDKDTHPVRFHDHTEEILVHCIQVIEGVQRDQGHMTVATGQQSVDMLERIQELERDNRILRDIMDVESQRVTRFWRRKLRVQRELRQIRRFRFYDRIRIARLEACDRRHLGYRS